MDKLILRKKTTTGESVRKPVFIKPDVHKQIKKLSEETGVPMNEIVDTFIRYGIDNVVITDEED